MTISKTTVRILGCLFLVTLSFWNSSAQTIISSQDRSVQVDLEIRGGQLFYEVTKGDQELIEFSRLGIVFENEDFADQLASIKLVSTSSSARIGSFKTGKKKNTNVIFLTYTFDIINKNSKSVRLLFHLSNDGLAYQYQRSIGDEGPITVLKEYSSFQFPKQSLTWIQPMTAAKSGWEQSNPSYEAHYLQGVPVGTPTPIKADTNFIPNVGWVYPALFKVGENWALITEAALTKNYCGTRLVNDSGSTKYAVEFPDKREVFTGKGLLPKLQAGEKTPLRVMAFGSLKTIVESTLGTDLSPSADANDYSFVKPGKASWSWINSKDDNITYEEQKKYIDFAAEMNWNYCLIDVNWDTKIGYNRIQELVNYGKKKNVGILLWYNSAGNWNTVGYHPKGMLLKKESREKEFSRIHDMGVKGVKIDFFGGDGQSMIEYYIDILESAAKYQLMVNFHGATLPRGWAATYPHLVTTEAVYGMEMVTFNQSDADLQASHCAVLPFTRNVFDPMDFTPMNLYKLTHSGSTRRTTTAFELALSVLFVSGIQHYAENKEGMDHMPAFVKEFLKNLPNTWNDLEFLQGFPGKDVVIARNGNNKWYIAGINGENHMKTFELDLSKWKNKKLTLLSDDSKDFLKQENLVVGSDNKVRIETAANGGFIIIAE